MLAPIKLAPLPAEADTLIPAYQAPNYLGIARQTLARWRTEGQGPRFVKLGRLVHYRVGDLREWINGQVRQNTAKG